MNKLMIFANAMPGVISQGLIWGILAIGVYITYKILDFADLTVDGSMVTGGAVCVVLIANGCPAWLALPVAFAAGCIAGLITGLLNTMLGIPGILAGILTQLSLYSINYAIMGSSTYSINSAIGSLVLSQRETSYGNTPATIIWALVKVVLIVAAIIAVLYWFFGTEYGFTIRATGCNKNMARAQSINTKKSTVIALVLSNGLVALAGAFLAQYETRTDINVGRGAIVIGLAAVIIGDVLGSVILRKRFNFVARLAFTAIGGIIYFTVIQMIYTFGKDIPTSYNKLFSAVVVAVFLAVPYLRKSARTSFGRAAKNSLKKGAPKDA